MRLAPYITVHDDAALPEQRGVPSAIRRDKATDGYGWIWNFTASVIEPNVLPFVTTVPAA